MCTIVIANCVAEHRVVIAANRDEMYARAASGPQLLDTRDGVRIVGGIDKERGGTWMGVTSGGVFVGLTNQRTYRPPDRSLKSRGHVVLEALRRGETSQVRRYLSSIDARDYNDFNIVYGDAGRLEVAYARSSQAALRFESVPDGLHVLPNDTLDSASFPKVERARGLTDELDVANLSQMLADHRLPAMESLEPPPASSPYDADAVHQLHALCIHTPFYGTRSSTIATLDRGGVAQYWFAAGPPCQTRFENHTELVNTA